MSEDKRLNEIIRVKRHPKHFVVMDKTFLQDSRLSCKAKGILAYLLSKPNNWKVIVADIVNNCADGKTAIYSGLKELKEYGYYEKVPVRNEAGTRIIRWESTVYEVPRSMLEEVAEQEVLMEQEEVVASKEVEDVPVKHWDVEFVKEASVILEVEKAEQKEDKMQAETERVESSLLSNFQEVQREKIQNWERNSNYNTKYLNYYKNNHVMSCQRDEQDYETTLSLIKENINYELLEQVNSSFDMSLIDEFVSIMVDTILSKGQTVRIGGEEKPRELVKGVLMKLNYFHLRETLCKFKECCTRIKKKRQYILSMLYNTSMELRTGRFNSMNSYEETYSDIVYE